MSVCETNSQSDTVAQTKFRVFYDTYLKPNLLVFEEQRKSIIRKFLFLVIGAIVMDLLCMFIGAIILNMLHISKEDQMLLLFIAIIATIIGMAIAIASIAFIYRKMVTPYKNNYKNHIITPIITLFNDDLTYDPNKKVSQQEFRASRLFKDVDVWTGEDYIEGKLGQTTVKFSEIHAQEEDYIYNTKDGHYQYYSTIFDGLFFVFNFHLNFQGITIILPHFGKQHAGQFKQWLQAWKTDGNSLVRITNPAFEQEFVIYSNNPIVAHHVLSNDFLRRLLLFHNRLHKPVYLSFVNGKMYMAISVDKDLFEPPVFHSVLNFQLLQEFFEYMQLGKAIVENLNIFLNQPHPYLPVVNFSHSFTNNYNHE